MAIAADRRSEAGVSLLEALLMVAVLAVVATIVLDVTLGGVDRAFDRANRSVLGVSRNLADERFRKIVANANGAAAIARAEADVLALDTIGDGGTVCGAWPAPVRIALHLQRDGKGVRLECRGAGGAALLGRWDVAQANFSYSDDGIVWRTTWSPSSATTPPSVRLDVESAGVRTTWIARPREAPVMPEPTP